MLGVASLYVKSISELSTKIVHTASCASSSVYWVGIVGLLRIWESPLMEFQSAFTFTSAQSATFISVRTSAGVRASISEPHPLSLPRIVSLGIEREEGDHVPDCYKKRVRRRIIAIHYGSCRVYICCVSHIGSSLYPCEFAFFCCCIVIERKPWICTIS